MTDREMIEALRAEIAWVDERVRALEEYMSARPGSASPHSRGEVARSTATSRSPRRRDSSRSPDSERE